MTRLKHLLIPRISSLLEEKYNRFHITWFALKCVDIFVSFRETNCHKAQQLSNLSACLGLLWRRFCSYSVPVSSNCFRHSLPVTWLARITRRSILMTLGQACIQQSYFYTKEVTEKWKKLEQESVSIQNIYFEIIRYLNFTIKFTIGLNRIGVS